MPTSRPSDPSHKTSTPSGASPTPLPTGHRHIPPSTRADGSLRREIKIRPGYRPPEDVEVYKNRTAEAWKNRGITNGVVLGAEGVGGETDGVGGSGGGGKNRKRREARRRARAVNADAADGGVGDEEDDGEGDGDREGEDSTQASTNTATTATITKPSSKQKLNSNSSSPKSTPAQIAPPSNPPTTTPPTISDKDKQKQARALRKKLRQARDLQLKKDSGDGLLPEQVAKVIKIGELVRGLEALGMGAEDEEEGEE